MAIAEEPGAQEAAAAAEAPVSADEPEAGAAPENDGVQADSVQPAAREDAARPVADGPEPTGIKGMVARARTRLEEPRIRYIALLVAVAALIAIGAGIWMWSQETEYGVLYSGFSEKDGGSIVAELERMEVPFKIGRGGNSIMVPAELVHGLRLKLASEGLPKASGVGFEVMENQKIGSSQFLEQVNFQRALEGELGRTIQSMDAIQHARVHLAMNKASVFVRDQQKPTASVLLTLYHGRSLDRPQVNAIVHLVASSVPGLTASNVTVVDQNGELLSWQDKEKSDSEKMDARQMEYVKELQKNIVKRVESVLAPVVGEKNVRAEATVEVDFGKTEQAEEIYKPNQAPNAPSIRSQQSLESQKMVADPNGGIPGAVTNQPPVPPTAPLIQQNPGQQQTAPPGQRVFTPVGQGNGNAPVEGRKESVINYEVDKTLRYVQKAKGEIKRLTVAVVVNYKPGKDENGNDALVPLTDAEKEEVAALVREAMGYNPQRGDSLSVMNTRFAPPDDGPPIWKRPETYDMAKDVGKYVIIGGILLWIYMTILKPLIYKLSGQEEADRKKREEEEAAREAARIEAEARAKAEVEARMEAEAKARAEEEARLEAENKVREEEEARIREEEEARIREEEEARMKEEEKRANEEKRAELEKAAAEGDAKAIVALGGAAVTEEEKAYQELLEMAKTLARENPKAVANIILEWLGND